ncbi:hypothetical protein [Nitratireductor sp. XY-223]|uniref:hypothetical protein n=1 Tax=Nitratireductor sp. XY-223 TaxID=2561926 RepID=UPI0010A9D9A9|nr:hypothetical protein [Nitratireductor sp. XY-223]
MIRTALLTTTVATALIFAGSAQANEGTGAMEGSYILLQDNAHQRVLSFSPGGSVSQVSDQEALIGFTASLGAWTKTGTGTAKAELISFNFDVKETGGGDGITRTTYELTFSDLKDGAYRSVEGSYSGQTFEKGENPLAPTTDPVHSFATSFTGQRVSAGPESAGPA